jgi:hypothetical protein
MSSEEKEVDPCPDIPEHFVQQDRIKKLMRQLKAKKASAGCPQTESADATIPPVSPTDAVPAEPEAESETEPEESVVAQPSEWKPPKVKHRRVVASRRVWKGFGPIVAAAAWSLGFFAAPRQAFVGDGSSHVWGVWRRHFSSFEPVLDWIHALSHVYAVATAGREAAEGWQVYERWASQVWRGEVAEVIEELKQRQQEEGDPTPADKETSVRRVLKEGLTYLENQQGRMKYAEYRRRGLPITSSHIESEIKRINQRVKGTEKFWGPLGAEHILQLRADYLSDDNPMEPFWQNRESAETGQRRYRATP